MSDRDDGDFQIGEAVRWHKVVSNYGHVAIVNAIVRKVGRRITIEVLQEGGGVRATVVTRERLRRL